MNRLPVTIVIPVKNESLNLPTCLDSVGSDFHQVVVVDSASTDDTREIAAKAGAVLLEFHWDGHFPKKRNWVLRNYQFETPWVLFLDADERLTIDFIRELRERLFSTEHTGFWIRFNNWFLDRPLRYGDPFKKLSLFRIDAGEYEKLPEEFWCALDMEVHEHPVLKGSVGKILNRLEHHDFRGIEHYRHKHRSYAEWEARRYLWLKNANKNEWDVLTDRQRFKYKNLGKWWLAWLYLTTSYLFKGGFRDGVAGFRLAWEKRKYFSLIRTMIKNQ